MKALSYLLFISLFIGSLSSADQGRGGGNLFGVQKAVTTEDDLYNFLTEKDKKTGQRLLSLNIATVLNYYKKLKGSVATTLKSHEELLELIDKGLAEDVMKSPYKMAASCYVGGKPTSMSTQKGVRNAEICINIPKILKELNEPEAQLSPFSLVGLLIHESARHFDYEDTTVTGKHPIASFVAATLPQVVSSWSLSKAQLTEVSHGIYNSEVKLIAPIFKANGDGEFKLVATKDSPEACSTEPIEFVRGVSDYADGVHRKIDESKIELAKNNETQTLFLAQYHDSRSLFESPTVGRYLMIRTPQAGYCQFEMWVRYNQGEFLKVDRVINTFWTFLSLKVYPYYSIPTLKYYYKYY